MSDMNDGRVSVGERGEEVKGNKSRYKNIEKCGGGREKRERERVMKCLVERSFASGRG